MAGLLGGVLAGGLKGYAEGRASDMRKQDAFNLSLALQEASVEKDLKLKQAGIDMEDKQLQRRRDTVAGIADSVKDPMAGKGGYEEEADTDKRNRGLLIQKGDALNAAGEYEAAKSYYARADHYDKSEAQANALDVKRTQIDGAITNAEKRLVLQGEANAAKSENAALNVALKNEKNNQPKTYDERLYEAYVNSVMKDGRKDRNGKISKIPMSMDKWDKYQNRDKYTGATETITETTEDEVTGKKIAITRKGRPKPEVKKVEEEKVEPWMGRY